MLGTGRRFWYQRLETLEHFDFVLLELAVVVVDLLRWL